MSAEINIWEQLSTIQNNLRDFDKTLLSLDELILIVLYAHPDKPIYGKTVFIKEIFVIYEEIFKNNTDFYVQNGEYYAYKYGPYSDKVVDTTLDLMYSGELTIENSRRDQGTLYTLTISGKERAKDLFTSLPKKVQADIIEYRKSLDELGHKGILTYVYDKYENYTVKSTIKDKYPKIEWGCDFD